MHYGHSGGDVEDLIEDFTGRLNKLENLGPISIPFYFKVGMLVLLLVSVDVKMGFFLLNF